MKERRGEGYENGDIFTGRQSGRVGKRSIRILKGKKRREKQETPTTYQQKGEGDSKQRVKATTGPGGTVGKSLTLTGSIMGE